jgi:hypothetical protein
MRHIRGADAPTDSADIRDAKSTESMGLTAVFLRCGFRGNRPRTPWKSHLRLYGKQLRIFLRNPRQIRTPVRTPKCSDAPFKGAEPPVLPFLLISRFTR